MQLFDTLPAHIEDALRASIERFGVLVPIVVTQDGEILDGHHRKRIADELGVEAKVSVVHVADEDEARAIAVTLNADRRQLDPEQRREVVAHLRQQGHSYRAIGEALGVGKSTVERDAEELSHAGQLSDPETVRGLDGKERPATRPTKVTERESTSTTYETPPDLPLARLTADDVESLERQAQADQTPDRNKLAAMMSSDTPEWYTPLDVVDRAVKVLDGIDLDPCSNSATAPNVPADNHFTRADDGLEQDWHGTVYMNPPYGRGIDEWVRKLVAEYDAGHVTEAIALVPARTDTQWFRVLRDHPVCFLTGRLRFIGPEGETDPAPFPSAAFYLGSHDDTFAEVFSPIGDVYVRWEAS